MSTSSEPDLSVAVVTRTKDRPVLLKRAIKSVLGQRHPDWHHVIVNDGGDKDDVDALVASFKKQYDGRVTVLHHEESVGREAASNRGLAKCDKRYVVFLDDDDTWHRDFMKNTLAGLLHSPVKNVRAVACKCMRIEEVIDEKGRIHEQRRLPFNDWLHAVEITRLCTNNTLPNMSLIFERSLIDEIGDFDESFPVLGDWDFNLRVALATEIHVVPEFLAFYHHRPQVSGSYMNSFYTHQHDLFRSCRTRLINKWIRAEYAQGRFSVADTMAFAALNGEGHAFSRRGNRILNALADWV